jgi:hypothetical protein
MVELSIIGGVFCYFLFAPFLHEVHRATREIEKYEKR